MLDTLARQLECETGLGPCIVDPYKADSCFPSQLFSRVCRIRPVRLVAFRSYHLRHDDDWLSAKALLGVGIEIQAQLSLDRREITSVNDTRYQHFVATLKAGSSLAEHLVDRSAGDDQDLLLLTRVLILEGQGPRPRDFGHVTGKAHAMTNEDIGLVGDRIDRDGRVRGTLSAQCGGVAA